MASLNKVMLIGNLTRDPEMRYLPSGKASARFGMAVNRSWLDKEGKRQEEASFFNLTAFEKSAEALTKYCKKGNRLYVEGRLDARTVTNDKGEMRTFHNIVVRDFQFLTPKKNTGTPPATPLDDPAEGAAEETEGEGDEE